MIMIILIEYLISTLTIMESLSKFTTDSLFYIKIIAINVMISENSLSAPRIKDTVI